MFQILSGCGCIFPSECLLSLFLSGSFNPFSTMTLFYIHSAYYLVILCSLRNSCGRLK
ncbi:hypothetical protein E2C01_051899 [Portunus trituberculatus]|uniref:Uncharacterized protein n=1 Tax=Portunus trituberculatus TaxID=210409 RepID=A0A5B7GLP2_PORTR|nr:hypothetical protein [Portunus trituberculatus]